MTIEMAGQEPVVLCNDPLFSCRCIKPVGHVEAGDKIHGCGPEVCGGSWEWLDDHRFIVHSFPDGVYKGAVLPGPERIGDRDGVEFVQCEADGSPTVPERFSVPRGGIRYFPPPSLEGP